MPVDSLPTPDDVLRARERIRSMVRTTPVMTSDALDELTGARLFFKCEHLQHTGSFKLRGASHAVSLLPDDCPGVATHSSGNHGAALACAAGLRGFRAEIVVPEGAVANKVDNIRRHGGQRPLPGWSRPGWRRCRPTTTSASSPARAAPRWSSWSRSKTWT
jgi:threonine dehydratase